MKLLALPTFLIPGLFLAVAALNACQKENFPAIAAEAQPALQAPAGDRSSHVTYGVTVFAPNHPSIITTILTNTGGAVNGVQVWVATNPGKFELINDLKGVCTVHSEVFVTTGTNNPAGYENRLLKVDPYTGQGWILSHSTVGTVSDIDYDESTATIYGLRNNSNTLVAITDNGSNWGNYAIVRGITNLGAGYVAKGLSMVRHADEVQMVVAATRPAGGNANLYSVPATGGTATMLTAINPANQLATGQCGIGFDFQANILVINRRPTEFEPGLNAIKWSNPLPNPAASVVWDTVGFSYEDLSTNLQ